MSNLDTSRKEFWDYVGDAVQTNDDVGCKNCPAYKVDDDLCHISCRAALRHYYEHLGTEVTEIRRYKAKVWVNQEFDVAIEASNVEEAKKKLDEKIEEFRNKLKFQKTLTETRKVTLRIPLEEG